MSKIKYILPLALLVSGTASAADEGDNPWYVGARLGGTHYSDISGATDKDDDDIGGGVFIGYNLTSAFALETGYTHLGEVDFNNIGAADQEGIDLVGKFTWNTSESMALFAKAGGFYYFTEGQDGLTADDDGLSGTLGLGLEYAFNNNLAARIEYQYYHDIELESIDWDTHFYGLSLVYSWGADKPMPAPMPVAAEPVMAEPEPVVEEPMMVEQPVVEPQPEAAPEMIEIAPLTVELPFLTDSDQLPQSYLDQLAPIAQHLIDYPEAQLFIVGHTDSRGRAAYNQQLSEQRAALVGNYLATEFNIDKARIIEEGRGELEPRATNETSEGRALNRRVSVYTPGLTVENK